MIKIGIVGPRGLIGSSLITFLKKKNIKIIKIDRDFFLKRKIPIKLDYVFHCGNSGNKKKVNERSNEDFINCINLLLNLYKKIITKKIILISTISVRVEKNSYAVNRDLVEVIFKNLFINSLIIRLRLFLIMIKKEVFYMIF